ncbi:MAG: hypothetical protein KGJ06_09610 [Pseudomonadota bacterium]|nr:hypothetical protein [Pseudomonadota bacterium]
MNTREQFKEASRRGVEAAKAALLQCGCRDEETIFYKQCFGNARALIQGYVELAADGIETGPEGLIRLASKTLPRPKYQDEYANKGSGHIVEHFSQYLAAIGAQVSIDYLRVANLMLEPRWRERQNQIR